MKIIGILLVGLGVVGLVYGGITYTTDQETADLGVAEVTVSEQDRLSIHPAIGGVLLVAGVVVFVAGVKRGGEA